MPDRLERLRQAAEARHEATLVRAREALQVMAGEGEIVTFRRLAQVADVSRSWLYRQPELRHQVEQARQSRPPSRSSAQASQRASADSLRQQAHAYRAEIARLRAENQVLKDQLARRLGAARAASVTRRP